MTNFTNPSDEEIRTILSRPTTVAVVGCSDNPDRDSLRIATLLKHKGFQVIPVNPQLEPEALRADLGERCYPDLASIPGAVEMVDVFRRSEFLPEIVEAGIRIGARCVWMQEGVVHEDAAARAREAGLFVVMDKCIMQEHLAMR